MALLGLGFLPSFLLAGLSASLLMLLLIISYHWVELLPICYDPTNWHSHEIPFGCAVAVIALFLLTAVHNWINHAYACRDISCDTCRLMAFRTNLSFFPQSISLFFSIGACPLFPSPLFSHSDEKSTFLSQP